MPTTTLSHFTTGFSCSKILLCAAIAWQPAGAGEARAAAASVPGEIPVFLGQHMLYTRSFDGLQERQFDGLRIWGAAGTMWYQIEPQRGSFDFSEFDEQVAGATARKIELMYTFGQTPRWASARPDEKGNSGAGAAAEPADMADWATYVRTVATRYKGRIGAYEVMNEPRVPEAMKSWSPGFFSGSVSKLAEMTRIVAEEVHKADPAAKIVCPSFDGFDGLKRLDTFLGTGAGKHCDIIGFHYYLPHHTIKELRDMVQETHRIATRHGLGKLPIWDTETGVLIAEAGFNLKPQYPNGAFSKMFDSAEAARLAAKMLVVSHNLGIERTYWFAHDTSWMGSTVADKRRKLLNPFGKSLAVLKDWLSGRFLRNCAGTGESMLCDVHDQTRKIGAVYWGAGKTPAEWTRLGYRKVAYLNGETASLGSLDASATVPRIADDVLFLTAQPVGKMP
ncbi:endo-1,4-beta-xylanase [Massilia sp. DWR3-1-1]|uniref:endo-1,4-beta-xylanase n=1 Tax=Massilia sp. DWR3-1-1 TaxID=2804559 RepID=UPI003CF8A770